MLPILNKIKTLDIEKAFDKGSNFLKVVVLTLVMQISVTTFFYEKALLVFHSHLI